MRSREGSVPGHFKTDGSDSGVCREQGVEGIFRNWKHLNQLQNREIIPAAFHFHSSLRFFPVVTRLSSAEIWKHTDFIVRV